MSDILTDLKYQLVAYGLLVKESFGRGVRRSFEYVPEALILQLEVTPIIKSYVKRVLWHIKRMLREEELPPIRVAKHKYAGGRGHKQICQQSRK